MIEFRQVTKRYSRFVTALDGINLTFERGEFSFITGPSGAGKSTLLKLLYAAERPTSGDVLVEGRSVARLHPNSVPYLRRNMGIVFQDFKLLPRRTILENVSLALEVCGVPPRQTRRRVMETIERVGLGGLEGRLPGELSGGEQQRAVIARAIVGKPTIILADEPTGNLDESMSHDIFELLSSICRHEGATILVATHDMAEVALWPFRQVRLWESRIEADRPALWQPWEHYPAGDSKDTSVPATDDLSGTGEAAQDAAAGEADALGPIILNERLMPTSPDASADRFGAPITGPSQPEGDDDDDAVEVSVEDSLREDAAEEDEEGDTEAAVTTDEPPETMQDVPQVADESQPDADKAGGRPHLKAIAGGRSGGGKP
jgi:cell division transport system ATP-binding protein